MTLGNKASERLETGLTFDDVLLVPRRSSIRSRQDVSLKTRLTTNIEINLPILAANMDTVCEQEMAITMASLGGVGILHRFMTVEAQAQMVENIKPIPKLISNNRTEVSSKLRAGDLNEIEFLFWQWNPLGIGSIFVITVLGITISLKLIRLELGYGFPELPP